MSLTKASFFSFTAIVGLSLLVIGCSKSNNSNNIPIGMTSQIAGKSFLAYQSSAESFGSYYTVGGLGTIGGDTVTLTVYLSAPFILNQKVSSDTSLYAEIDYRILKNDTGYAVYSAANNYGGHAYYTVTAVDTMKHTIAGTFSGTLPITSNVGNLPDSVVIANGQFNTTYQ
jgi:hypothetical protein